MNKKKKKKRLPEPAGQVQRLKIIDLKLFLLPSFMVEILEF